jgi:hypothetical protein
VELYHYSCMPSWCARRQLHLYNFPHLLPLSQFKRTNFVRIPLHLLRTVCPNSSSGTAQYPLLLTNNPQPQSCSSLCWQNAHFRISWSGWWCVLPLHPLALVCRFIVVHLCFSARDNLLQRNIPFITSLQKLIHISKHVCLCSSACCRDTHLTPYCNTRVCCGWQKMDVHNGCRTCWSFVWE